MLKPYKDPTAWRQASLKERLQSLRQHYCTGPCGQGQIVGEIRSNTDTTLKEADAAITILTAERDSALVALYTACTMLAQYSERVGHRGYINHQALSLMRQAVEENGAEPYRTKLALCQKALEPLDEYYEGEST